jgi:hypothetical protein
MKKITFFLIFFWVFFLEAADISQENSTSSTLNASGNSSLPPDKKKFIARVQDTVHDAYKTAKPYLSDKVQTFVDTTFKKQEDVPKVVIIRNHTRLKRWMFNKNFRKGKSKKDILYHTFHPIANYFIEKYGKQAEYVAGKFRGMQYSLKGLIEYPNDHMVPVIFTITKNQSGSWYHRGIIFLKKKNKLTPTGPYTPRILHYKFGNNGLVREIVYLESSSWIKIYDAANEVTLYLKKDDFL